MIVSRRSLFKAAAIAPAAALPDIPEAKCEHEYPFYEKGEIAMLYLVATQERLAPLLEIEQWKGEVRKCPRCGFAWIEQWKERTTTKVWDFVMRVPPVVAEPMSVIWPVNTTCRVWVDGQEIDWLNADQKMVGLGRDVIAKYWMLP